MKRLFLPFLLFLSLLISCSTYVDLTEAQSDYYEGNYESSLNYLITNSENIINKQGSIVYYLDEGIVSHSAEKYDFSINSLATAEREIEANFTKSISANIGSYLLNESVRDYSSSFYEDIYTNIFLSLNYYHVNDIEDAMVEVRRSLDKLQLREQELPKLKAELEKQLADNNAKDIDERLHSFDSAFYSSALSYYLSSLFSLEYGDYDTFRISRDKGTTAYKVLNKYYMEDYYYAFENLNNVNENSSMINFLAFSGLSPIKRTQIDKNVLVLESYKDDDGIYHPDYYANVVYTVPLKRGTNVKTIEVFIDGEKKVLQPFENLELVAYESLEQTCSSEYIRAYIRAVSREVAKSVADTASLEEGQTYVETSVLSDIFSLFSVVSEGSGDLRTAHFFPAMSWIGSFMVNPGEHDIVVKYLSNNNSVLFQERFDDYLVIPGRANLVEIISAK
ncbi:MAG: hypothetical protein ACPKM0_09975 [Pleomorphochaeta sp.]